MDDFKADVEVAETTVLLTGSEGERTIELPEHTSQVYPNSTTQIRSLLPSLSPKLTCS